MLNRSEFQTYTNPLFRDSSHQPDLPLLEHKDSKEVIEKRNKRLDLMISNTTVQISDAWEQMYLKKSGNPLKFEDYKEISDKVQIKHRPVAVFRAVQANQDSYITQYILNLSIAPIEFIKEKYPNIKLDEEDYVQHSLLSGWRIIKENLTEEFGISKKQINSKIQEEIKHEGERIAANFFGVSNRDPRREKINYPSQFIFSGYDFVNEGRLFESSFPEDEDEIIARVDSRNLVNPMLSMLSDKSRQVFNLYYNYGFSINEISQIMKFKHRQSVHQIIEYQKEYFRKRISGIESEKKSTKTTPHEIDVNKFAA